MSNQIREPFYSLLWKASIGYNDSWSMVDPEVLEKFGELIVQQCAQIASDFDLPKLSGPGMVISNRIEEYFDCNFSEREGMSCD